ncbi:glycosyltransferase family 4 protein [Pseudomonas sp. Irchel s3h14]|uniref:glycosyltransferase family 4 protein n=1 Tax=Pseudomonas sp. Irchel s3h14 TaxID=2009179 RepID=UPI000BA3662F|nr:glycosyltransferase family 4 protein [Pseudomonas sp. Irchel s3h14]
MNDFDLDRLQETVVEYICRSQYGDAMACIRSFAEQVINDPASIGVVFASRELDALCRMLADAYYYYADRCHVPEREGQGTVILASELVRAGGHTELIKDYLALGLFESPVRVALTDLFNRIDHASINEWESLLGCEVFVVTETGLDGKLDALTARLGEWNPSTVLTLGHNQDIVCIVAAHAPGFKNRYYIHHGDHHLSLGVTCEAFQHVDLHNMSYELCKNEIGVAQQLYWPISAVRTSEIKTRFLDRGALTTCSCGRMSKFESGSYAVRYERAVACILKASRGYHVHIGELSDAFLQKIHEELDAENVSHDRFVHIPWVASLSQALIENAVDVYVSSFPLGGGKSLIEAMSIGVPVVTHESYRSRYHAGSDLAYPDSYTWSQYEELGRIFKQWDQPLLKQHAASAQLHFERYYSQEALLKAFASGLDSAALVPPLHAYHRNQLQNHLDIKRQKVQEIGHLISEEHSETIAGLQAVINQLTKEKLALEASVMTQRRNEGAPGSWKGKIRKIAAVILDK